MLRVLLVEGTGHGFLSHYAHALGLGMHQAGMRVRLLTQRGTELASWAAPFDRVACMRAGWRGVLCVLRQALRFRPDVVHLQWVGHPVATALAVRWLQWHGIRVVYTPHNILPHRARWANLMAFRWLYRQMDHVVARDPHIAWSLQEVFEVPKQRLSVLTDNPNLIAWPGLARTCPSEIATRKNNERRVLFCGHGGAGKGLGALTRWTAALSDAVAVHLVVAGEWVTRGADTTALQALCANGKATVIDRYLANEEVAWLLADADLLVLPYRKQCKSPWLDLAGDFGLPVLRSDRVDAGYFVDGTHGLTVGCDESDATWERALTELLHCPTALPGMREEIRRQGGPLQSVRRFAATHEQLYLQLVSSGELMHPAVGQIEAR